MNGLPDKLLVAAAVLAAIWYAARTLGPRSWRLRRGARASGSCGGCDSCAAGSAGAATPGADVSVPLSAIGRRPPAARQPQP
jgi:hypothetical protein